LSHVALLRSFEVAIFFVVSSFSQGQSHDNNLLDNCQSVAERTGKLTKRQHLLRLSTLKAKAVPRLTASFNFNNKELAHENRGHIENQRGWSRIWLVR
jgi:hypothetical protein